MPRLLQSAPRFCLFRPPLPGWQQDGVPEVLWRTTLLLVVAAIQGRMLNGSPGHLEWQVLPDLLFPVVVLWLSSWLVVALAKVPLPAAAVLAELLGARLVFALLQLLVLLPGTLRPDDERIDAPTDYALDILQLWWLLAALTRVARITGGGRSRVLATLAAFAVPWLLVYSLFAPADFWQADSDLADDAPAMQPMSEAVFHDQPNLFDDALDAIEGERPGVDDLYFLGVAGDGGTPAFRNEVEMAGQLLDERFDTRGRSMLLANDDGPDPHHPFATRTNLAAALARFGEVMDDDDILMLFVSSHGTREHTVVLAQSALALDDLDPAGLRAALDDAGIRWRIVVISACYSGGFIDALRDDHTLVITASDADHTSFGCGTADRYTWFGQALFDEQLRHTLSIPAAFRAATRAIAEREKRQGEQPSNPQMVIGAAMGAKLAALERRLAQPGGPGSSVQAWSPARTSPLPVSAAGGRRGHPRGGLLAVSARGGHRHLAAQAGMSGVREQARTWISSLSRSLRFLSRRSDSSSMLSSPQ